MTRASTNSAGFSRIGVLIIVAAVVLLCIGGWLLSHKHHATNTTVNHTTTSTTAKTTVKSSTANGYFTVAEWGVRSPYTGSDRFTYTLSDDGTTLTAISQQLAKATTSCSAFGGGQIIRQAGTDAASEDATNPLTIAQFATDHPDTYRQVGKYYYQFHHDEDQCDPESTDPQDAANAALAALVSTLQAIPVTTP